MVNYGLEDKVAIITGANNPQGIGATTALAFAREGAKVVLVYKRILRPFDKEKADVNGTDRYFSANSGGAEAVESKLQEMKADYLVLESDISNEKSVNCVAPGPTQTGWIDNELEKAVLPLIPMGELIQPEDIANAILFLSSEQAGMLTGQVIKVSGGHAL